MVKLLLKKSYRHKDLKEIKFNQDMKFNIIIRSILNYKNISEISAASGVVLDSSSKKEFNENFIKAKSLLELYKWFI